MMGRRGMVLSVASVALIALACDTVTRDNYEQIKPGMSVEEVESILGPGAEASGVSGALGDLKASARVMRWEEGDRSITVTFLNDQVTAKTMENLGDR